MRRPSGRTTPGASCPRSPKRMSFMASHLEAHEAAVDRVVASGDERGVVRTEKERELRHFVGAAHAADGLCAGELFEHLALASWVALGEVSVDEWRMDPRRRNGIAANVVLYVVAGYRVRHRQHGAFAHRVREAVGDADGGGDGRDVENRAAASLHRGHARAQTVVHALHVHRVDAVEIIFRRLLHCSDMGDAGAVDEDIDVAELFGHHAEALVHLTLFRHVAGDGERARPPPEALDLAHGLPRRGFGDVDDRDARAGPGEANRDRPSDAGPGTGYEGDLVVKPLRF